MQNQNEIKRKKIMHRSKYRGTKELDLLIGEFIKQNIQNDKILDDLIALLDCHDAKIQACLINDESPPPEIKNIFALLQKFKMKYHSDR